MRPEDIEKFMGQRVTLHFRRGWIEGEMSFTGMEKWPYKVSNANGSYYFHNTEVDETIKYPDKPFPIIWLNH